MWKIDQESGATTEKSKDKELSRQQIMKNFTQVVKDWCSVPEVVVPEEKVNLLSQVKKKPNAEIGLPLHEKIGDQLDFMQGEVRHPKAKFTAANALQKRGLMVGHYLTSDAKFADENLAPLDMPHCLTEFDFDSDILNYLKDVSWNCMRKDMEFKGDFLSYEAEVSRRLLAFQSISRWALDALQNISKGVRNGDAEKEDLADDLDAILRMSSEVLNFTDEKVAMIFCNCILKKRDAVLQKTSTVLSDDFVRALRSSSFSNRDLFCFREADVLKDQEKKKQDTYSMLMDSLVKAKSDEMKASSSQKVDFKDRQKGSSEPKKGYGGGRGGKSAPRGRARGPAYFDSKEPYKRDYDRGSNRDSSESKQSSSKDQGDNSQEKYHKKGGNK